MAETTEKRKTLTIKKAINKVVDIANDISNQSMQEQDLMQGKMPKEKVVETTPESKVEITGKQAVDKVINIAKDIANQPMQEQDLIQGKMPQSVEPTINLGYKNGVGVESIGNKIKVSFPHRKDINYALNDGATGLSNHTDSWKEATPENKLYFKERLQTKEMSFNKDDLTPGKINNFNLAVENARTINSELMNEKQAALDYFKHVSGDNNVVVLGIPFKLVDQVKNGQPTGLKIPTPSYFNGDIVKAGKHLIGAIEGSKDKTTYVRLIETSTLPLTAHEYADRNNATKNHLEIGSENIGKININGKEHEIILNKKLHIAFDSDWKVSKKNDYIPKAEQSKNIVKKQVQTMAR